MYRSLAISRRSLSTLQRRFSSISSDTTARNALVLGSSGALGSLVTRYLSQNLGCRVVGADVQELPSDLDGDWELDGFVKLPSSNDLPKLTEQLVLGVEHFLEHSNDDLIVPNSNNGATIENPRLDVIVVASGGFGTDPEYDTSSSYAEYARKYAASIQTMLEQNLYPVLATGAVAQRYLDDSGLVVVLGATVALQSAAPNMLGYCVGKSAAHYCVQSLGSLAYENSLDNKAVRQRARKASEIREASIVGILPTTLDTPQNRINMPTADFSKWTQPMDICAEIGKWVTTPALRPHSGSLVKVYSAGKSGGATYELVR